MPPFREGPIKIDRKLSGELLHFLRDVGHGHRVNIVDASYDIPQGSVVIEYPGTTAEALEATVRLIPIEGESVEAFAPITVMDFEEALSEDQVHRYEELNSEPKPVAVLAYEAISAATKRLSNDKIGSVVGDLSMKTDWTWMDYKYRLDREGSGKGFYSIANNPDQSRTFIRTQDDLPFACISLVVGHSQRTE